jgi:carbonic anhydrase/acetyltransferase-like protein (isoleucine patch superfamily)
MAHVYAIDGVLPVVDPSAFVHPAAVLIGDVLVGPGCYVGPGASLRGDFGRLVLESGCNIQDNCVMHGFPGKDCVIERDGHVGHGAIPHGCRVGRNALIGMNAVIMDGATIGEDSIVAALAFVKAGFEVPPRSLAGGVPARIMRALNGRGNCLEEPGHRRVSGARAPLPCQPRAGRATAGGRARPAAPRRQQLQTAVRDAGPLSVAAIPGFGASVTQAPCSKEFLPDDRTRAAVERCLSSREAARKLGPEADPRVLRFRGVACAAWKNGSRHDDDQMDRSAICGFDHRVSPSCERHASGS